MSNRNQAAHAVEDVSRITKTPHQQRCAQFTGMSASIPAVTSLRDLFRFSSLLLPPTPKPHRNRIFHRHHPRTNPPSWHPTVFADSATQGNQDGYRVSTLSLRGRYSSRCIHPQRYTQTISVTLFTCNSTATSDVLLSKKFSRKKRKEIKSRRKYILNLYPILYKSAFIFQENKK